MSGFLPSRRIQLAEVFDYLASVSQVRSSQGSFEARCNQTAGGFMEDNGTDQAMIDLANLSHCVSELERQQNVHWAPTDVLPKFALKTRQRPGAVAVAVARAYQPWHLDPDAKRPAGEETMGVIRGPDRGLAEVHGYMNKCTATEAVHTLQSEGKTVAQIFRDGRWDGRKSEAAKLLADADIVIGAWVDLWNKKAGFKNYLRVAEFAAKYEVPISTVKDWCAKGKLDAVIVGNAYKIDVSGLDESYGQD